MVQQGDGGWGVRIGGGTFIVRRVQRVASRAPLAPMLPAGIKLGMNWYEDVFRLYIIG